MRSRPSNQTLLVAIHGSEKKPFLNKKMDSPVPTTHQGDDKNAPFLSTQAYRVIRSQTYSVRHLPSPRRYERKAAITASTLKVGAIH